MSRHSSRRPQVQGTKARTALRSSGFAYAISTDNAPYSPIQKSRILHLAGRGFGIFEFLYLLVEFSHSVIV